MQIIHDTQQEELKTIKKRTLEINLSDADIERLMAKTGAYGLTVGEMIENLIGDLVDGTYSNGSTERALAKQWFEQCWFSCSPDYTFLRHLIDWEIIDDALQAWDSIAECELMLTKAELEANRRDAAQEEIEFSREVLADLWNEYDDQSKEYKPGSFDKEWAKVLAWRQERERLLNGKEPEPNQMELSNETQAKEDAAGI